MADSAAEVLLARFGIDLTPIKKAGAEIKATFQDINAFTADVVAKAQTASVGNKKALDELRTAAQAALAVAKQAVEQEKVKQAELKTQTAETQKQVKEQQNLAAASKSAQEAEKTKQQELKSETAELEKQRKERQAETAEIQKQIAEIRKKRAEEAAERREGGEGGIGGGLRSGIGRAIFGQGLAGGVAAGVLAGGGIAILLESAAHAAEHFVEKIKEAGIESAKLTVVEDIFQRMAKGAGIDAAEAVAKLQEKTEGLVDRLSLLKFANASLRRAIPVERMEELAHATVTLAESGVGRVHNVEQAMNMLTRSIEQGNGQILARSLGLDKAIASTRGLSPILTPLQRQAVITERVFDELIRRATQIGEVPKTFESVMERMKIARKDLLQSFTVGVQQSGGIQVLFGMFAEGAKNLTSLQEKAKAFGDTIGKWAVILPSIGSLFKDVFKDILLILYDVLKSVGLVFSAPIEKEDQTKSAIRGIAEAFVFLDVILDGTLKTVRAIVDTLLAIGQPLADVGKLYGKAETGGKKVTAREEWTELTRIGQAMIDAPTKVKHAWDDAGNAFTGAGKRYEDLQKQLDIAFKPHEPGEGIEHVTTPEPPNLSAIRKSANLQMQGRRNLAKLNLEEEKADILAEKELDDKRYADGEETLQQHLDKEKELADRGRTARLTDLALEHAATLEMLKTNLSIGVVTHKDYDQQVTNENLIFQRKLLLDEEHYQKEIVSIENKGAKDRTAAAIKALETDLQLAKKREQESIKAAGEGLKQTEAAIKSQQDTLQKQFEQGEITPTEFFQRDIQLIQRRTVGELDAAAKVIAAKRQYAAEEIADAIKIINLKERTAVQEQEAIRKRDIAQETLVEAEIEYRNKVIDAAGEAESKLTSIIETEAQKRLSAIEKQYQPQQRALESQISVQQERPGVSFAQPTSELLDRLLDNIKDQRTALEQAIKTAVPYSDTWYQILDRIEASYQAQLKYNQELQRTKDYLQPVADFFGNIAKSASEVFHGPFVQNLANVVGSASRVLEQATQRRDVIAGRTVAKDPELLKLEKMASGLFDNAKGAGEGLVTPFDNLKNAVDEVIASLHKMSESVSEPKGTTPAAQAAIESVRTPFNVNIGIPSSVIKSVAAEQAIYTLPTSRSTIDQRTQLAGATPETKTAAEHLQQFAIRITTAISAITDFASAIGGAKSAIGGAFGGAVGGAGLAQTASGLPGLGALAGPWGQAAGAIGGAVIGGIVGQKNQAVTRNIDNLNRTFKSAMHDFSLNTNNLQNTIVQLGSLLAQAQQMQQSSKKGHGQYQQAIDQYIQQIQQLQEQQHQVIVNLHEQLSVLQAPQGMQEFLGSLQDIIKQYRQFEGAAQSVDELAQANEYLVRSLQAYELNLSTQLNQDNTQAINDALQLNDLMRQRYDLTNQLNGQIQSVLSQGVLTRQQTFAQTKGQQIYQIEYQYKQQSDQLNEEIAATTYKVQNEAKIFTLATTRIGLETQLLQLQNAQTDYDITRITALRDLLTAIASGNYNFGPILGIINATPGVTNPIIGGGSGGATDILDQLIAGAYQNRSSLGFSSFRGTNLQ